MNKRSYIFLVFALFWMGMIFFFSSRDGKESTDDSNKVGYAIGRIFIHGFEDKTEAEKEEFAKSIELVVRKAAHMTEYAILGILFLGAIYMHERRKTILYSWMATVVYAATDEIHQLFVPGRDGKITDVIIDSIGAILGIIFVYMVINWRRRIKTEKARK